MHESISDKAPGFIAPGGAVDKRTVSGNASEPRDGSASISELHCVKDEDPDDRESDQWDENWGRKTCEVVDIEIVFHKLLWRDPP